MLYWRKDEALMNGVQPLDDLYQFLFDALSNDNLLNAINYAADCGISIAELSKTSRKLLESYDDLAKVNNLYNVHLGPLIKATYNHEFIRQWHNSLYKTYCDIAPNVSHSGEEIEDPIKRVKYQIYMSINHYYWNSDLAEILSSAHILRSKKGDKYSSIEQVHNADIAEILEDIKSLLFNNWYGVDVFGEPTAAEIVMVTNYIGHSGLRKYVLRNYKDILQSTWDSNGNTEWNNLKGGSIFYYSEVGIRFVDILLDNNEWKINDEGELISSKNNKPVELNVTFPPAFDVTDDYNWLFAYRNGTRDVQRFIFDMWDKANFEGKPLGTWRIKKMISELGHPGIMKYALKKYQKELIEDGYYDSLCEDIKKVEDNLDNYEHLIKLYDRILADNGIDIEALTAELGTSVSI